MKILYLLTLEEPVGGAQIHVRDLAFSFSKKNKIFFASGQELGITNFLKLQKIDTFKISNLVREINPIKDILSIFEIRKLVRNLSPDIISIHSSKAGVVGRLACIGLDTKVIFTAHGWSFAYGKPFLSRLFSLFIEKIMYRFANLIICVSCHDYKISKSLMKKRANIITIQNGMPPPLEKIEYKAISKDLNILMVGRLSSQKDHISLVKALKYIKFNGQITLNFIGGGKPNKTLITIIKESEKSNIKINLIGEKKDLNQYYKQAHLFILTSFYEGLPRSIIEAMSYKLPVISSNVGGCDELVEHGENGFLINKNDPKKIAEYINIICSNRSIHKKLSEKSEEIYHKKFRFELMADKTFRSYSELH